MTSGYWLFVLLIIPVIAGVVGWLRFRQISLLESFGGMALAAATIAMSFQISECSLTSDSETWSGRTVSAQHIPWWKDTHWEEYEETYYTGTGKNRTSHTVTKRRRVSTTHSPKYWVTTTLGDFSIGADAWQQFATRHGVRTKMGSRPNMTAGDPLDYSVTWSEDKDHPLYPINISKSWDNKLLGTDSIVNLREVKPEEAKSAKLFEYPEAKDLFSSNRLLGPTVISKQRWEQMNAVVGPLKGVNVILVNFGPEGSIDQATTQRAYWKNGKKNDLVICIGAAPGMRANWAYVFGWSESELVKQNLQNLFIDRVADDAIIPLVEKEIKANFKRFDWHQFDNLEHPMPWWGILLAVIITAGGQAGFYFWALNNNFDQRSGRQFGVDTIQVARQGFTELWEYVTRPIKRLKQWLKNKYTG